MLYLRTPQDLVNVERLAQRLGNLLKPGVGDQAFKSIELGWQIQGGVSGTHVQRSGHRRSEPHPDPLAAVFALHPAEKWTHPVVLAIDEFQNTPGDRHAAHALVLQALHEQEYGVPLMVLLAGLGDTVATAARLGISRVAAKASHALGCFTPDESADLVVGWGRHFKLPEGRWQSEMRSLAAECDHWPVHLQNALTAFAEQVVVYGNVSDVDFAAVRARSRELRLHYYGSRMSPEMRSAEDLLAAVMQQLPLKYRRLTFIRMVESTMRDEAGWRPPDDMNADDFFNHLLHRGALQELPDGSAHCPIPSFRKYVIGLGERARGKQ